MLNSFWSLPQDQLLGTLQTGKDGLSEEAAAQKLSSQNKHKKVKSRLRREVEMFLGQFKSPLVMLLIAAVILSAFLGSLSDVFIILFILLGTGTLSFIQERSSGRAVEKLQSMVELKSTVERGGKVSEIPSGNIVPGDIIVLNSGDIVPADCYLLEANELYANEASLTGESYPQRKEPGVADAAAPMSKRNNSLWQGSNIVSGTARAVAVNTGQDTVFGGITKSLSTATETTFERGIHRFGFFLMQVTIFFAVGIMVTNLLLKKLFIDSVLFALALAIGMAPELLPAIMTIAMSAGAKRMLEKKVIVKKLSSIQNLGEINLLCTDKTGTITEGIIKISGAKDAAGNESSQVMKYAFLNANFESGFSNPLDDAIRGMKMDITGYSALGEIPYDFLRKRLSIAISDGKENMLITKGAVSNILDICTSVQLSTGEQAEIASKSADIQKQFQDFSNQGFRVIGVCHKTIAAKTIQKEDEAQMVFDGFLLLEDPLKEGIPAIIAELSSLGIGLKVITGDNRYVAAHVAGKLNIHPDKILSGPEIQQMSLEALAVRAKDTEIFAEIEPQQKEMIIHSLQKAGFTLAYIGDGINDVAAINAADAGISVSNAVDVAREAADFVLLEKDLSVLAAGVREGRRTFANTLKYIFINTGATFGNIFSVAIASLTLPFLPMLPKQILLTNFITSFPFMAIASDNVDDEQLTKPGKWNLRQLRIFMVVFGLQSSIFDVITFITLYYGFHVRDGLFQTGWFFESILTQLAIIFILRTQRFFLRSMPGKNLLWLSIFAAVLTTILLYLPFHDMLGLYSLPIKMVCAIFIIVIGYIITADITKRIFFRFSARKAA